MRDGFGNGALARCPFQELRDRVRRLEYQELLKQGNDWVLRTLSKLHALAGANLGRLARLGLAVHPCSPLFVHAQTGNDRRALSPLFADTVDTLAHEFNDLVAARADHSMIIVLRFSRAAPPTVRSRRRPVRDRDAR